MGQVPFKILLVGDGRLAKTLASLYPQVHRWSRQNAHQNTTQSLSEAVEKSDPSHIWLAVSDRALPEIIAAHRADFANRTVVHFAGSLSAIDGVYSAHPLSTFSGVPQSAAEFAKIPFVLDLTGPELPVLLPGLKNDSFRLAPEDRAYYHALCSMSGNFTTMLWESVARRFDEKLGIPAVALETYREQIFQNLAKATGSILTGPLVRGDSETVAKHLRALADRNEDSLLKIYDGFADLHSKESK